MPKKEMPPPRPAGNRRLQFAAASLAALFLIAVFATPIADTDFWWHLKTGQYLSEQHRLPFPDPFSYTASKDATARFNLTHEWLAQLLMYDVYAAGGFTAIAVARAVLLACICGIAGYIAALSTRRVWVGIAARLATASVMVAFAADRPALVTFLGVAVFIAILETRRYLWSLPVLALLWANCHGGFFLGWVVLAAYCVRDRTLWKVSLCAIAASIVNPNGFGVIAMLFRYRGSAMQSSLLEWQRPSLWGRPYGFDLLLYATAAVLALQWRRIRVDHWILFGAFAAASIAAFRNVPLIGLLGPVLIARYAPWRWAVAVLAAAAATGAMYWRVPDPAVAQWTIPAAAADFLSARAPGGRIFNTYEQGGYWIWRGQRVFIDGRALNEAAYGDYRQILFNQGSAADAVTGPRKTLLDRYGIDAVAMNAFDSESGALYPLAIALGNPDDTEWNLVYEDHQELVFMRHPPPGLPVLSNKFGRTLRHLNDECVAYIEHSPENALCARTLADYWIRNQAWGPARRMLTLYLQHRADAAAEDTLRRIRELAPVR